MSAKQGAWGSWQLGSLIFPLKFQAPPYLPNVVSTFEVIDTPNEAVLDQFVQLWKSFLAQEVPKQSTADELTHLLEYIISDIGSQVFLQDSKLFYMLYNYLNADSSDIIIETCLDFFCKLLPGWIVAYRRVGREFQPRYLESFEHLLETNVSPKRGANSKSYTMSSFYAAHLLEIKIMQLTKNLKFLTSSMRLLYELVPLLKAHINTAVDYVCFTMSAVLESGDTDTSLDKVKCNVIWESLGYYLTNLCETIGYINGSGLYEDPEASTWTVEEATELLLHYGYLLTVVLISDSDIWQVLNPLITALDMLSWQSPSPFLKQFATDMLSNSEDPNRSLYASFIGRYFYLPPMWQRIDLITALVELLQDPVTGGEFSGFLIEQTQLLSIVTFELIKFKTSQAKHAESREELRSRSIQMLALLLDRLADAGLLLEKRPFLVNLSALWLFLPELESSLWLAPFSGGSLVQIRTSPELRVLLLAMATPDEVARSKSLSVILKHFEVSGFNLKERPDAAGLLAENMDFTSLEPPEIAESDSDKSLDDLFALPESLWDFETAILPLLRGLNSKAVATTYAERIWKHVCGKAALLLDISCPRYLLELVELLEAFLKLHFQEPAFQRILNDVDNWLVLTRVFLVTYHAQLSVRLQSLLLWFVYCDMPSSTRCSCTWKTNGKLALPVIFKGIKLPISENNFLWEWVSVESLYEHVESALRFSNDGSIEDRSTLANVLWNTLFDFVRHDVAVESAVQARFRLRTAHLDIAASHEAFLQQLDTLEKHTISVYDASTCLTLSTNSGFYALLQKFLLTVPGSEQDLEVFLSLVKYLVLFANSTSLQLPSELLSLLMHCCRMLLFPQVLDPHCADLLSFESDSGNTADPSDLRELQIKGELVQESIKLLQLLTVFHMDSDQLYTFATTTTVLSSLNKWLGFFVKYKITEAIVPDVIREILEHIMLVFGALWTDSTVLASLDSDELESSLCGIWRLFERLLSLSSTKEFPTGLFELTTMLLSSACSSSEANLVAAFRSAVLPVEQFYALISTLEDSAAVNMFKAYCVSMEPDFIIAKEPQIVEESVAKLCASSVEPGDLQKLASLLWLLSELARVNEIDVMKALLSTDNFFAEKLTLLLSAPLHHVKYFTCLFLFLCSLQESYPEMFEKHVFLSSTVLHLCLSILIADGPAICEQQQVARACGPFVLAQFSLLEDGHMHMCRLLILKLCAFQFSLTPKRKYWRDVLPCVLLITERCHQRFEAEQESFRSMDASGWLVLSSCFSLLHDFALAKLPQTELEQTGSLNECLCHCLVRGELPDIKSRLDGLFHCVTALLLQSEYPGNEAAVQFLGRVLQFVPFEHVQEQWIERMMRGLLMCWMDWKDAEEWAKLQSATVALCALLKLSEDNLARNIFIQLKMPHYLFSEARKAAFDEPEEGKWSVRAKEITTSSFALIRHFCSSRSFVEAKAVCVRIGFLDFFKEILLTQTSKSPSGVPSASLVECLRALFNLTVSWDGVLENVAESLRRRDSCTKSELTFSDQYVSPANKAWSLAEAVVYQGIISLNAVAPFRDVYGSQFDPLNSGDSSLAVLGVAVQVVALFLSHLEIRRGLIKCGVVQVIIESFARAVRSKEWKRCCVYVQLFLQFAQYRDGQVALCKGTPLLVNMIPCLKAIGRHSSVATLSCALLCQLAQPKENRPYFFAMSDLLIECQALARSKDLTIVASVILFYRIVLYDFHKAKAFFKRENYFDYLSEINSSLYDSYPQQLLSNSEASKEIYFVNFIKENIRVILQELKSV